MQCGSKKVSWDSLRLNLLGFLVSIFKFYGCVHPYVSLKMFLMRLSGFHMGFMGV